MNKRILHLFNEAGFHQPEMERMGIEHKFEKFAELIVRECADILEPNGAYAKKYKHAHVPGPDGSRTPLSIREFINMQSAQKLREHFGVEL